MRSEPKIEVVYRPKTKEEGQRRAKRAVEIQGPFIRLPGNLPVHRVCFVARDGSKVRVGDVEMVFNDMLLMDAISGWGEDGPLYEDTVGGLMAEILEWAKEAYAGVELPPAYIKPGQ